MADVVYLVRDMLFTSKIREVAKQLGVSVESARDAATLARAAATARIAIVDLRLDGALEAVAAVKGGTQVIGFVDHEKVEVMDAARASGCSLVLTKGQFARDLPRLLAPPPPA